MEMVQYTVRPGNTLFGIAQFFQTTVNDILKYNNIQTPDAIFVGQVLTVPAGSAETQYHVARPLSRVRLSTVVPCICAITHSESPGRAT